MGYSFTSDLRKDSNSLYLRLASLLYVQVSLSLAVCFSSDGRILTSAAVLILYTTNVVLFPSLCLFSASVILILSARSSEHWQGIGVYMMGLFR